MAVFFVAYIFALPTSVLCYLGFGRSFAMGTHVRRLTEGSGGLMMDEVISRSGSFSLGRDYFEASDGFVAFNLSKSVVHTIAAYPIQSRDTLYSGLSNPITDQVFGALNSTYSNPYVSEVPLFEDAPNTIFEDARSTWTVAPIFASPSECLKGYSPLHITCMLSNRIIGWAFSTDSGSFCRTMGSSACSLGGMSDNRLSIYYPGSFNESTPPSVGLSGILSDMPPDFIVEALKRRFIADGWPLDQDVNTYPNGMPTLWVHPVSNVVSAMEDIKFTFSIYQYVAIGLIVVTLAFMLIPFVLDVWTDLLVKKLVEKEKKVIQQNEEEKKRRSMRRSQVFAASQLNRE